MSLVNRKTLYDKLMREGKEKEAAACIINHPEMAAQKEEPKSKGKR